MIDTGAELSLISPGICNPKWKTEVNISLVAFHKIVSVKSKCTFPIFKEFKLQNYNVEFLECNFNEKYDGLIGSNILKDLGVIINYNNRTISTKTTVLKLYLDSEEERYLSECPNEEPADIFTVAIIPNKILDFIKLDHLNTEEKSKLKEIVIKFKNVFYKENDDLSFTNEIKHRILTECSRPVYSRIYRYPEVHREEVDKQIDEMLKQGIITKSKSPYNSPIWIIPKKTNDLQEQKWRIVIDYRKLNKVTIDDKFPMPNIEDLFDKLGRCMYFSTLDLAKGFHQVEVDPRDREKTAFSTATGHYEFVRMPFGLKNSPSTFQRMMNGILAEFINKICVVYLDDILIFSTSLEEHLNSLTAIFKKLSQCNLKVQLNKCSFLKKETEYLGHIITKDGIKPNPEKIKAILKIELPKTVKEIRSFLGMSGFYRKFIRDYSKIAYHMTKFLKKNVKLDLKDKDYSRSFEKLKEILTQDPILIHPDFKKKFSLITDASNYALGGILMQGSNVIAYYSRTLNDHERQYSTIEKELLAIVDVTKYFRPYIFGRRFTIKTDHRPLVWLDSLKEPNSKLQRWKIKLNEYDYDIEYIKGKTNAADALSRLPLPTNINFHEIEEDCESNMATIHSAQEDSIDFIDISERPVNVFKNQIYLQKAQTNKITHRIVHSKVQNTVYIKDETKLLELLKHILTKSGTFAVFCEDNELFVYFQNIFAKNFAFRRKLKIVRASRKLKDILDHNEILEIIEEAHKENNHRGINELYNELKTKYFYPNLKTIIHKFINNCEICKIAKYDRSPIKFQNALTKTARNVNDIVHIDIWFPERGKFFLTTIDKLSKYATVHTLEDRNWQSILRAIKERIQFLGKMKELVSDGDTCIVNAAVKEFLQSNNIVFHKTTAGLKTGNADIERLHGTLNEHLRVLNAAKDKSCLKDKIYKTITIYNGTIHSSTGFKPINFIENNLTREDMQGFFEKQSERKRYLYEKQAQQIPARQNPEIVENRAVGKCQPKYKKLESFSREGDCVIDRSNKRNTKYNRRQIKRLFKYEN